MRKYSPAARGALLKWVNLTANTNVETLADLEDGVVLGETLEAIFAPEPGASDFRSSSLVQHPSGPAERKQNLERVYRDLARFLRSNSLPDLSPSEFRAIAGSLDEDSICELLSYFLAAACLGLPKHHVPTIMQLERSDQLPIKVILEERRNQQRLDTTPSAEDFTPIRDADLLSEENERITREKEHFKKEAANLMVRLEDLQMRHEVCVRDLETKQEELRILQRGHKTDTVATIRLLQEQIDEKIAEIDRLESLLEETREHAERLEKENQVLKLKADGYTQLLDKVQHLEHDKTEYERQIKMLENYKKKVQDHTALQQRFRNLEEDNEGLKTELSQVPELQMEVTKLRREIKEKISVLSTVESDMADALNGKVIWEEAYRQERAARETLERKAQIDAGVIKELEEKSTLGYVEQSGPASPGTSPPAFNLEQELESTTDATLATLRLEMARLKAENSILRNNMTVSSENERLRSDIDRTTERMESYRIKAIQAMEKEAVVREQINLLVNSLPNDQLVHGLDTALIRGELTLLTGRYFRDRAFVAMRRDLNEATRDLGTKAERIQQLERELADRQRELLDVQSDRALGKYLEELLIEADSLSLVNAVGKDSNDALAVLKSSDGLISASLRNELEATRKQLDAQTQDVEEHKEQLMDALVSNSKLRKQLEDGLASSVVTSSEEPKSKREDMEKSEKLKTALRQKMQQLEKAEQERYELQRRLKAVENGSALAAQKHVSIRVPLYRAFREITVSSDISIIRGAVTALTTPLSNRKLTISHHQQSAADQVIKNLQRENAMITTAWYDLTSRLQSNHIVLQRRHDAPKSWLNKQRQIVNATVRK